MGCGFRDMRICARPRYEVKGRQCAVPLKMMRSVCFVDRLELEFSGNHFSHAITIGDPDNDGVRG